MSEWTMLLSDYTFQIIAIGSTLLGITSGVIGSFVVLRKQGLIGDGISHAALPGVVLAFLMTGSKETGLLLLGALITGLMAMGLIHTIVKLTKIPFDSALATVLSVFFGGGVVLLTYAQKIPNANQAGLDRFIYGQTAAMLKRDVYFIGGMGIAIVFIILLLWKELKVMCFDQAFAKTIGIPVNRLERLLACLIVLTIVMGLQAVGVILMSAMLIAPAIAARQWTKHLGTMLVLSAVFGGLSGIMGTFMSSVIEKAPTGPLVVVCSTFITVMSLLIAPNRGILSKIYKRKKDKHLLNQKSEVI